MPKSNSDRGHWPHHASNILEESDELAECHGSIHYISGSQQKQNDAAKGNRQFERRAKECIPKAHPVARKPKGIGVLVELNRLVVFLSETFDHPHAGNNLL